MEFEQPRSPFFREYIHDDFKVIHRMFCLWKRLTFNMEDVGSMNMLGIIGLTSDPTRRHVLRFTLRLTWKRIWLAWKVFYLRFCACPSWISKCFVPMGTISVCGNSTGVKILSGDFNAHKDCCGIIKINNWGMSLLCVCLNQTCISLKDWCRHLIAIECSEPVSLDLCTPKGSPLCDHSAWWLGTRSPTYTSVSTMVGTLRFSHTWGDQLAIHSL